MRTELILNFYRILPSSSSHLGAFLTVRRAFQMSLRKQFMLYWRSILPAASRETENNTKPRNQMLPMKQYDAIDLVRTVEANSTR